MQNSNKGSVFIGIILVSLGVGFYFNEILVSLIIGIGIALIIMALFK